jgi:anti-anti-sigma factor
MNITEREKQKYHIIDVNGKINRLSDSIKLKTIISRLLENNVFYIALNLAHVTYIDSGALNVLIYSYNYIEKKNGTLCIIGPNEYIRDVLEVVGLNKIVKIYTTEEDFENDKEDF